MSTTSLTVIPIIPGGLIIMASNGVNLLYQIVYSVDKCIQCTSFTRHNMMRKYTDRINGYFSSRTVLSFLL